VGWGLGQVTSKSIIHNNLHKPNNKLVSAWLEHFWCMDKPWTYTNSQNSPWPRFGEATNFPFIVHSLPSHRTYIQMSFCPKILKLEVPNLWKLELLQLWKPITFCVNLRLNWGLKQSCSPRQEISNNMSHVTCTQVNQRKSWLLVVRNQIANLIFSPSFHHNLCFTYSNGMCEPILNIYVFKKFQWSNGIRKSSIQWVLTSTIVFWRFKNPLGLQLPKWEPTWECVGFIPSHLLTFLKAWNVTPKFHSWPAPLQALVLVMSLRLGLQHLL